MSEPFLAEIVMFGGNFNPRGWSFCDGQLLPISTNSALFSLLGTTYGGDGRSTFALPDLRGRFAMHPGMAPGLGTFRLGQKAGVNEITQPPAHYHTVPGAPANSAEGDQDSPAGRYPAAVPGGALNIYANTKNATMGANGTTGSTGQSGAVSVQNPYACVNFIIALVGVYPSRS